MGTSLQEPSPLANASIKRSDLEGVTKGDPSGSGQSNLVIYCCIFKAAAGVQFRTVNRRTYPRWHVVLAVHSSW
jgi:hypothetical protein